MIMNEFYNFMIDVMKGGKILGVNEIEKRI